MTDETKSTLMRWAIGWACFGFAGWCVERGVSLENWSIILSSVPLFLIGVAVVWRTIFYIATRPLLLLIDSLFFPGGKLEKPILNLKLPRYYIEQGRFDEALNEYKRILKHYPDETEAYEKAIWLYTEVFEENDNARRLMARAKRRRLELDELIVRQAKEHLGLKQKTP